MILRRQIDLDKLAKPIPIRSYQISVNVHQILTTNHSIKKFQHKDTNLKLKMKEKLRSEVTSEISLADIVESTPDVFHPNEIKREFSPSESQSHSDFLEHAVGSMSTGTNLKLKMKEEAKSEVTSEISLTDIVECKSDVLHANEIKKEFSLTELESHNVFLEHAVGTTYPSMNLELKMEEEVKPEDTSAISLTAIVDSASGVPLLNEIKKEFLLSDPQLHDDFVEHAVELTPPNIVEAAKITSLNSLPEISKKKYENAYKLFKDWRKGQKTTSYSENVLMSYFGEISKKYKSSTLWTQYSMLKTLLNINNNVDIAKYSKLKAFLKRQSYGYRPKTSKNFTANEINKFIKEAPDEQYLLTKVSLIMGIMGACRRHELHQMKTTNFNDLGSAVIVTIPDTKTKIMRKFTITGHFYEIFKKYANLRPPNVNDSCFFLNFQKGKCTVQRVGINKFGAMGKQIAKYLKLPNPESYTGRCFRRSSESNLVDAGEDITFFKRLGGWKSLTVSEGYIDESNKNKFDIANKIVSSIENTTNMPSTSRAEIWEKQDNLTFQQNSTNVPIMIFNNCSNITFNIVNNNK